MPTIKEDLSQTTETPYSRFRQTQADLILSLGKRITKMQNDYKEAFEETDYQISLRRYSNNPRAQQEIVALQQEHAKLTSDLATLMLEYRIEARRLEVLNHHEDRVRGSINYLRNSNGEENNLPSQAASWLVSEGLDGFKDLNFATESWRHIDPESHPKAVELLSLHSAIGVDVAREACQRVYDEMGFTQAELDRYTT